MINEVLYMQIRLFQEYCLKHKVSSESANTIFNKYKIWKYIEDCYDTLHLSGDDSALYDIDKILKLHGVQL